MAAAFGWTTGVTQFLEHEEAILDYATWYCLKVNDEPEKAKQFLVSYKMLVKDARNRYGDQDYNQI